MKLFSILFMLMSMELVYAQNGFNINTPQELNQSCKDKSIEYFKEKNKIPRNWSSLWRTDGNVMDIKGTWQVDDTEYIIMCRIKQGLNESMVLISINEKKSNIVEKNTTEKMQ